MQTSETQDRRYASALCCICKEGINFEIDKNANAINLEGFDPCTLVIVAGAFGPRDRQKEQEFCCHMECFRKVINDDSLMYILNPEYGTFGETRLEQEREAAEIAETADKGAEQPAV